MFQMEDNEKTNGINQKENAERAASLLSEDDVAMLEYYLNDDGARGYFGRAAQFLDDFIESGVTTTARADISGARRSSSTTS